MTTNTKRTSPAINFGRVAAFSSTGIVMGLLTVFVGLPSPVEPLLWVLAYSGWVVWAQLRSEPRPLTTFLFAGALTGLFTGLLQVALLPAYLDTNPQWAAEVGGRSQIELLPNFVGFGVGMGLTFGLIFGLIAFALRRRRQGAR